MFDFQKTVFIEKKKLGSAQDNTNFIEHNNFKVQYNFLGHLSNSGDLLLWVGVRRRALCVNIFFSRTTRPILTKFGM